jgi:hypothetical protein
VHGRGREAEGEWWLWMVNWGNHREVNQWERCMSCLVGWASPLLILFTFIFFSFSLSFFLSTPRWGLNWKGVTSHLLSCCLNNLVSDPCSVLKASPRRPGAQAKLAALLALPA